MYERQQRYYHLRAGEYDRGAWEPETAEHADEVGRLVDLVAGLAPARTLDVGCGTGFLSQHLRGELTLLDASEDMLAIALGARASGNRSAGGRPAAALPGRARSNACSAATSTTICGPPERRRFLEEARRVAPELVLVQQRGDGHREGPEQRTLEDGTSHEIYKTLFTADSLLAELGGGKLLYEGPIFLVARL